MKRKFFIETEDGIIWVEPIWYTNTNSNMLFATIGDLMGLNMAILKK